MFAKLAQLKPGELIRVEYGDSSWKTFVVADTQAYSTAEASVRMFDSLNDTTKQLTLITCTGNFDDNAQTYDKRIIVRAALQE